MSLYQVSGVVEAPDGTTYRPLFYGDFYAACRVSSAIVRGAVDRGEGYQVEVTRADGSLRSAYHSAKREEVTV